MVIEQESFLCHGKNYDIKIEQKNGIIFGRGYLSGKIVTEIQGTDVIKTTAEVMENNNVVDYSPLKNIVKNNIEHGFNLKK
jgi:hypothetical protein